MTIELIFTGNGPGELAGWVRPVARAARELAQGQSTGLRLTMALTPSQFASGREREVIHDWRLFDRILEPAETMKLSLGIGELSTISRGTLVHLGGDLWFSARLSRRVAFPACVLAETTLVARRHGPFAQIFATSEDIAERLVGLGLPREKVVVTGDPRVDSVEMGPHPNTFQRGEREYIVSFMPSSRDYLFQALVPYFLRIAEQLGRQETRAGFHMVVSPFLSPEVVSAAREDAKRRFSGIDVWWVVGEPWPTLKTSDFVLTVPGTNTVELAAAGVPFAAIAPAELIDHLRLEGLANWISRLPLVGRPLKRLVALRMLNNQRFIALPNQRAGRLIAPQWVGAWPEDALISHLIQLLRDRPRRLEMSTALRQLYAGEHDASRRIAERSLALAGGLTG